MDLLNIDYASICSCFLMHTNKRACTHIHTHTNTHTHTIHTHILLMYSSFCKCVLSIQTQPTEASTKYSVGLLPFWHFDCGFPEVSLSRSLVCVCGPWHVPVRECAPLSCRLTPYAHTHTRTHTHTHTHTYKYICFTTSAAVGPSKIY